MMGGGAFILLKVGRIRPESAKQAESPLDGLLKILRIDQSGNQSARQGAGKSVA
jgi:hypothetical protein